MKNKNPEYTRFTLVGFLIFLATIWIISTATIIVFYLANKYTNGNIFLVALFVLLTIIGGAFLCSFADVYRRKKMVEEPVRKILRATEKIASGDFEVKLTPTHEYAKYDAYDLIYNNINTMVQELSKNEMLKNDFISNVSHEIKTPLSVIQNYAKALQAKNITKEKQQEYLQGLIAQTSRLSELISNILKLNKLENQRIVPEIEEIDLSELLISSTLSFESLFEKKNLKLVCKIAENVKLTSSASLLEIVFNNLISNAIKFTDEGGKIEISLIEDQTSATVKIKDTGCGISKEVGEHIFEKFYQGDTSRATEGNGLGLALVKKVIDTIGGDIMVESKVGKGSTFTIKLKKG